MGSRGLGLVVSVVAARLGACSFADGAVVVSVGVQGAFEGPAACAGVSAVGHVLWINTQDTI